MDEQTNLATKFTSVPRFLDAIDYSIIISMLALSAFTGIYFANCSKKKPNTTTEYLIGDRKIGLLPIAMSLAASYIGSPKFLGVNTDIYKYGTQLLLIPVSAGIACLCSATLFIPVLYKLNMISSYEYFKLRFNNAVRIFGAALFVVKMLLFSAIQIYGPSITLAQATGMNLNVLIPCISLVCIFYTSIGGLRAVVWADTLQMIIMILGAFSVMIIGSYKAGGIENIWEENKKSGRIIFFQMKYDSSAPYTFWDIAFGNVFNYLGYLLVNQSMTQRCLSLPSFRKTQIFRVTGFLFITVMLTIVNSISALAAYTIFHDCDPIKGKIIARDDQIMPYFMMKITENIPAIPGIYLSTIFSASLSSVSTGLNSMAGVILIDFIRPIWKRPISEARQALLMKITVLISGMIFVALVFLIDALGGLLQTVVSLQAISQGALLGIFVLGMFFPWANSKGALTGGIAASALIMWMSIGSQMNKKRINTFHTSLTIDGCDNSTLDHYYNYLNRTKPVALVPEQDIFSLYKVSFFYYSLIGVLTVVGVGLLVSFLTGPNNPKEMDPNLFPNVISRFCRSNSEKKSRESLRLMETKTKT